MACQVLRGDKPVAPGDRGGDGGGDLAAIEAIEAVAGDVLQYRREVRVAQHHARVHRRIQRVGDRLAAQQPGGVLQCVGQVARDRVTVLREGSGGLQHRAPSKRSKAFDQPSPCLDGPRHGDRQHAALRHGLVAAPPHSVDGRELSRPACPDQSDRRASTRRPNDRHQVAGHRRHLRIHHAQHGVRGDGGVDRVAAVAQHLRTRLAGEPVRRRNDALCHRSRLVDAPSRPPHCGGEVTRHRGVRNSMEPGWISNSAGSMPGSSPSMSRRTCFVEVTSMRLPYMIVIFGLWSSK